MKSSWSNWARTESADPVLVVSPKNPVEIQMAVRRALETGHAVKPIGASHSFTGIGATDGISLRFNNMRGLVDVDTTRDRVTLWAGTHLWELPQILDPLGLAIPNMGDIDAQTIAGATQTGTHGTGLRFGGLATGIVGLTLIDGTGEIVEIDESTPDLLSAAALSLGALGVITTITLQCVPRFLLCAEESPAQLEDVLNNYLEISRAADHFEFYWFPHTKSVRTKTNTRLRIEDPLVPLNRFSKWLDEEFVNNDLLRSVLAFEHRFPKTAPRINNLIESVSSRRTYTDLSYRVFVTKRRVRFKETEFAIPVEAIPDAMRDIDLMIERKKMRISFPIEVRNAKADSLMMSTAHERETGYIAVHRYHKDDEREYFNAIWQVLRSYEGRPHWGKMHDFNVADLEKNYPKLDNFLKIRNELDPDRVFSNPYLERILGK